MSLKKIAGLAGDSITWRRVFASAAAGAGIALIVLEMFVAFLYSLGIAEQHLFPMKQALIGTVVLVGLGTALYTKELLGLIKDRLGGSQ